ncbi:RNA polymerase sigma-70 factor [Prolixibacteraceae bacterium Z1-6]|uniref:RNA polymerase sigma-70 factor n=1 Tax=Draconibacterium aestuarii TaxID=2998507 RepID=A0A9X3F2R5_9BACT|nr:RNA polymerase sigma-70 factor [Prolixibacteraceae bacterium Z1-6]
MLNSQNGKFLIAQGNQKEFRRLMELSSDELLHFALGFLRDKEVAEEIVSDVYVRIWKNREEILNIQNLKSYLFICVKNGCLSHLRKMRNEKIVLIDEYNDFLFLPVDGPEDDSTDKEVIAKIYQAIETLPPKCKLAFTLAKINGLKHKEIAEVMDVSEKTVNNHLVSAVKKITEMLGVEKKSKKQKHPLKQASLFSFLW